MVEIINSEPLILGEGLTIPRYCVKIGGSSYDDGYPKSALMNIDKIMNLTFHRFLWSVKDLFLVTVVEM